MVAPVVPGLILGASMAHDLLIQYSAACQKAPVSYGGLNVLEAQMGIAVQRKLPAQHLKTPKAG